MPLRARARNRLVVACVVGLLAAGCSSGARSADSGAGPTTSAAPVVQPGLSVARPTITGPVSGGTPDLPVNALPAGLAARYGYTEKEYFLEGTATAYRPVGTWSEDGRWTAAARSHAAYKTRILVRAPQPSHFNGTVIVEWFNETSGRDADPDFGFAYPELMKAGYAYVGVTAQVVGIEGGGAIPIPGYHPRSLVHQNPARYRTLHIPSDDYSYDIFSQAAQAIRRPDGPNPLGPLHPRSLIATGESQSAARMVSYVDAVAPLADIYDGYLIHSRGGGASAVDSGPSASPVPKVVHIRTDLGKPVMQLETETDLFGLGFYPARQPDSPHLRTWELAGTSHVDQTTLDYGIASGHVWSPGESAPDFQVLCGMVNDGPESILEQNAIVALADWVGHHGVPPHAPAFVVTKGAIARDAHGIALGGIRTPAVDVPISTLSGEPRPGASIICSLFGQTTPFTPAQLAAVYPTHADYVAQVQASAASAVRAGFLLPASAAVLATEARAAAVPS
jgi:hypothetical protein